MKETVDERTNNVEVTLQELLTLYLRKWWQIVLCAVLAAGISLGYTYYFVTPTYQADISIYVNNNRSTENLEALTNADVYAAQRIVNTYSSIAKSDRVLDKVAQKLGGSYTAEGLAAMITAEPYEETEILCVYVVNSNPKEAARIANVMAEVAPEAISDLIDGTSARVIDTAKVPTYRHSPSYRSAALYGGLFGALLCAVAVTIMFLTDTRIKDEEDLTAICELPILGRVPDFEKLNSGSSYGYKYGYKSGYRSGYGTGYTSGNENKEAANK